MKRTFLKPNFLIKAIISCLLFSIFQEKILAQNCNFYPEFQGVRVKTLDKKGNFQLVSTKKEKVSSAVSVIKLFGEENESLSFPRKGFTVCFDIQCNKDTERLYNLLKHLTKHK